MKLQNVVKFAETHRNRTCRIISPFDLSDYHFDRALAKLKPVNCAWVRRSLDQELLCSTGSRLAFSTMDEALAAFMKNDLWYIHRGCDSHHAYQVVYGGALSVGACVAFTFSYSKGFSVVGPLKSVTRRI